LPILTLALLWSSAALADVSASKAFLKDVQWLGHDTFRITAGKVIYVDPFRLKDKDTMPKADIILITHDHYDHCSPADVRKILKPDTFVVTTVPCAVRLRSDVSAKILKRGATGSVDDIVIEAVPAYNIGKTYHPQDRDGVGYVVTVGGKRLYFAGDTDHIPEMRDLKDISIAFLPVSGTYVMTAEEAARAALEIKPDVAVPMHYGAVIGTRMDAELFAEKLRGKIEVVIMKEE
jgi:L-ascorbate metabolism protein UlaG (beta-lactamase superfamily)